MIVLCYLNEHNFRHNFQNCAIPLCHCSLTEESTTYFFLHCNNYGDIRQTLIDNEKESLISLYGSKKFSFKEKLNTMRASVKLITSSERFSSSLFQQLTLINVTETIICFLVYFNIIYCYLHFSFCFCQYFCEVNILFNVTFYIILISNLSFQHSFLLHFNRKKKFQF